MEKTPEDMTLDETFRWVAEVLSDEEERLVKTTLQLKEAYELLKHVPLDRDGHDKMEQIARCIEMNISVLQRWRPQDRRWLRYINYLRPQP